MLGLKRFKVLLFSLILSLFFISADVYTPGKFPYREAGLTKYQAAAILLDRFTFGPKPGEVDQVLKMGLRKWFNSQLQADLPDDQLDEKLQQYPVLSMSEDQILQEFPNPGMIIKQAKADGIIPDSVNGFGTPGYRKTLRQYALENGYKLPQEMIQTLFSQKILRAVYSRNQLRELMTDFWFNHFNVSLTTGQTRNYILSYENDAIRKNALGNFRTLLGATAKSPAMLFYLNNAESHSAPGKITTAQIARVEQQPRFKLMFGNITQNAYSMLMARRKNAAYIKNKLSNKKAQSKIGINENYGRELMELHTLGVNGGYTQQDVIEVARCFTGWTVMPRGKYLEKLLANEDKLKKLGFIFDGQFLFNANQHDAEQKIVLGHVIPAGGGINDGEEVLNILAYNPATAKHISLEIAQKFVSDNPPKSLVSKMSNVFLKTHGDIKSVLTTIVKSPEFWKIAKTHSKIKSPLELAVSAVRALNADVLNPMPLAYWIARMGEPLYSYLAPTGYPGNAKAWINTGSLLNRMNFGLMLAEGRINGIEMNLYSLNDNIEPESIDAALKIYSKILLPGRDISNTIQLLTKSVHDPEFTDKISQKADEQANRNRKNNRTGNNFNADDIRASDKSNYHYLNEKSAPRSFENVVGLILGSPEFQRR